MPPRDVRESWIEWYDAVGATDAVGGSARRRYGDTGRARPPPAPAEARDTTPLAVTAGPTHIFRHPARPADPPRKPETMSLIPGQDPISDARRLAGTCDSLEEIVRALETFEGCGLRDDATQVCVADGNPRAPIMMIGEAPGAEEDRQGRPFAGPSGKLLDRMMATIGLDRERVYITNLVFWRPPGNRQPTSAEIAVCQPFLERQIQILKPKVIQFVGGMSVRALLNAKEGITRLRGRGYTYDAPGVGPIPALVMFHPAYLLRQPAQKRFAWRDMLALKHKIAELGLD